MTALLNRHSLEEALEMLSEEAVEQGQALRDAQEYQFDKHSQGLWVLKNSGNSTAFESELQLQGRKVKAYTCDCSQFETDNQCGHLAALLALVELALRPVAKARIQQQTDRESGTLLSMHRMVNNAKEEEILAFVKEYARKDSRFALAFKLRFTQNLPQRDRFHSLIKQLLQRSGAIYSQSHCRQIDDALEEFAEQRKSFIAERNWIDLFDLNTALSASLILILDKATQVRTSLPDYIRDCLLELKLLVKHQASPSLLEQLAQWTQDELERGAWYRHHLDLELIELFKAQGAGSEEIIALLAEVITRYGASGGRLKHHWALLHDAGQHAKADGLLLEHLADPGLVFEALRADIEAGKLERAAKLAGNALVALDAMAKDSDREADPPQKEVQTALLSFLVQLHKDLGQYEKAIGFASQMILQQGSFEEAESLLAELSQVPKWRKVLGEILVNNLSQAPHRADIIATLRAESLIRMEAWDELQMLLYASTSSSFVLHFAPRLIGRLSEDELMILLETKIREVLEQELGQKPADWTVALLEALRQNGYHESASQLSERLRDAYRSRIALISALDEALL